jgi:mono/diheme cytochrome c family protein
MKSSWSRSGVTLFLIVAMAPIVAMDFATRNSARALNARTVWDSVYSAPQAARGESAYAKTCARCHGASLAGANEAPPLAGGAFLGNWNGLSLGDLQNRIQTTMPSDSVGVYNRTIVTTVMAYLLKANGFPAGQADLPEGADSLKVIMMQTNKP